MYLLEHPLDAIPYSAERAGLVFRQRTLAVSSRALGGKEARGKAPEDIEIRLASRAELDALTYPDPGGWLTLAEARMWLERGYGQLIAAVQQKEIVAYCWLETGVVHLDFF